MAAKESLSVADEEEEGVFLPELFDVDSNNHSLHRMPKQSTDYATARYWEERYAHEDGLVYDWYSVDYKDFQRHFRRQAGVGPWSVLEIGSGNSEWSDLMAADGLFVMSTDISSLVLEGMATRPQPKASGPLERVCVDACQLPFRGELFDYVIDKGTMDALSCMQEQHRRPSYMELGQTKSEITVTAPYERTSSEEDTDGEPAVGSSVKLSIVARVIWNVLRTNGCWFVLTAKAPSVLVQAMGLNDAKTFIVEHEHLLNGTYMVIIKKL